jgi:hypothetical protein
MKPNPNIVSVGDARARAETPRAWWGRRDYENHAAEQRAKAQLHAIEPLPGPSVPGNPSGLRLYDQPKPRRSPKDVDRLLEKLGIRPRA